VGPFGCLALAGVAVAAAGGVAWLRYFLGEKEGGSLVSFQEEEEGAGLGICREVEKEEEEKAWEEESEEEEEEEA